MKRRAFISLLGGVTAWPLAARAQQSSCVPLRGEEKKRAAGVVGFRRLVLALRGLTGLLNPCVRSGTKLFQPYFVNCFNCASPAVQVHQ